MATAPLLPRGPKPLPRGGAIGAGGRPAAASRRRMFSLLAALTAFCGLAALLALHPALLAALPSPTGGGGGSGGGGGGRQQRFITGGDGGPAPLAFPLWWHAPIFSESGERRRLCGWACRRCSVGSGADRFK